MLQVRVPGARVQVGPGAAPKRLDDMAVPPRRDRDRRIIDSESESKRVGPSVLLP